MAPSTQGDYVRAVRKTAEHYNKLPDQIIEKELREYFLYLKNVRKLGRSTSTLAMCGIKFFYTYTLKRDWPTLTIVRAPHEHKISVVLSHQEVKRVLSLQSAFSDTMPASPPSIYPVGTSLAVYV